MDAGRDCRSLRRDQRHVEGQGAGRRVPADPEMCRSRRRPRRREAVVLSSGILTHSVVMPGLVPGIHANPQVWCQSRGWPGHRRAEATPFFERLCPAMTIMVCHAPWMCAHAMSSERYDVIVIGAGPAGLM